MSAAEQDRDLEAAVAQALRPGRGPARPEPFRLSPGDWVLIAAYPLVIGLLVVCGLVWGWR